MMSKAMGWEVSVSRLFSARRGVAQTEMSSSGSLSRFLPTHLGEAEEQRCQLFDPPEAESFDIVWSKPVERSKSL
jgi:hypothetical protein